MRVIFTNKFQHFARVHATRTAKRRQQAGRTSKSAMLAFRARSSRTWFASSLGRTSMSVMFAFLDRYLQAIPFAAVRLPPGVSCPCTTLSTNTHSVRYLMNENCMKGAQSFPATTHFRNRWGTTCSTCAEGLGVRQVCCLVRMRQLYTHINEKRRVPAGALRASGLIGRREACGVEMARRATTEGMGR